MISLREATKRTWDVVVVGGGPAGALAARQISLAGASVLLVDRGAYSRWKVCGCCLNGSALATLTYVSLGNLIEELGAIPLNRLRVASPGCQAEISLSGVSVSREAFDSALIRAGIERGVHYLPETNATLGLSSLNYRSLTLNRAGQQVEVNTKLVLAADGLGGNVLARQKGFSAAAKSNSRVGAGIVLPTPPAFVAPGTAYMAYTAGGYVGLVTLEDGRLNVAAAFDRETVLAFGGPGPAAANIISEVGWPVAEGLANGNWRGTAALTRRASQLACDRVLVLGDAAGYVEPFTGEGIAWALASAVAVAPLALSALDHWDASVGEKWSALHSNIVSRRQNTCRIVAWVLRHPTLTQTAIRFLRYQPFLAKPVVRRLNAPSTLEGSLR